MFKKIATALLVLFTGVCLTSCTDTGTTAKTASQTQTLDTAAITNLIIDAQTSHVTISPSDDNTLRANLLTNKYAANRFTLATETTGSTLTLKVTDKTNVKDSATLDLKLPQKTYDELQLNTTFGDLTIQGTTAKQTTLTTITGDIEANGLQGNLITLTTNSGTINVQNADSNTFRTTTTSGDITISQNTLLPTLTAETRYGNIDLHLPPNTSFFIEANAHLGTAKNHFRITRGSRSKHKFGGSVYNGTDYDDNKYIHLETWTGRIEVHKN